MNPELMITDGGGLRVPVKCVTWFQFLQLSRVTNSDQGGWNFKGKGKNKHLWVQNGLARLTPAIVEQWTKNSLEENALPKPRKQAQGFKLSRADTENRTKAGESGVEALKSGIDELLENELNALLYIGDHWPTDWGQKKGYEVPLADESDGQLKIDLVGHGEDSPAGAGFLSLIELKQSDSPKNSPLMALTEAICYAIQIIRCENLLNQITGGRFQTIRLILAAPEKYWTYWEIKKHSDYSKQMTDIVEAVGKQLSSTIELKLEMHSLFCDKNIRINSNRIWPE